MADLSSKKVAIVVDNYFEEAEFSGPLEKLKEQGAQVDIIATESKDLQAMEDDVNKTATFTADYLVDDADMSSYDALVLPGGTVNADHLRTNESVQTAIKSFIDAGKPVAAICHAPWALISAGVVDGRKLTSFSTLQDDLRNAGADWVDEEVVVDDNLITSRNPDDVPAFSNAIIDMLTAA